MDSEISFGYWVRRRRKALDLTQEQLAQHIGCALDTIRKIESGARRPSRQIAERLAELLDVPTEQRPAFLQAARAELAADRLSLPPPPAPVRPSALSPEAARRTVPSGTVTFLCTDIVGSTKRWEQYPEAMRLAVGRHDTILRQTIAAHDGVVFKSGGDGVYAAFSRAPDALVAAVTAQRALRTEAWSEPGPLHVRMVLHTGVSEERDGDYFGAPLNRTARLLAVCHGDQILLSRATQELVCDTLSPDVQLLDVGIHRLKDLSRPEHIFQVLVPDLPSEFPPLRTLDTRPHNLPAQLTPLIGRSQEIATLCERLRQNSVRLLTLTGPGGTGKTRLALQVAAELIETFQDGVFFVDLAPITDPALVISAIAGVLGVQETGDLALVEWVKTFLRSKQLLLVLDNFEQIVRAALLVEELLETAARVKVLVTSREVLHLYGEHEVIVPPLPVPDPTRLPPLDRLSQYDAVRLFIERAQAVQPTFTITNTNAPAVAEMCVRLDGLPLAIELAAARSKLFSPDALLARLSHRLQLLTGGARMRPLRQQTVRNTIAWSYDLLTAAERALFTRLGVFVGGCTLEAAETICNADSDIGIDVLDGLASLVDKSLLKPDEVGHGELRFVMLETIREYALELLEARTAGAMLRQRHLDYYLVLAETAEPELATSNQLIWLDRLEHDHDNVQAALVWALNNAPDQALRLTGALADFWLMRGYRSQGRQWLERALAGATTRIDGGNSSYTAIPAPATSIAVQAKALHGAGMLAQAQEDDTRAEALFSQSLTLARSIGDLQRISLILLHLGGIADEQGNGERAMSLYNEGLALAQANNDHNAAAQLLNGIGDQLWALGDMSGALASFEQSLAIYRGLDNRRGIARSLRAMGQLAVAQQDRQRAAELFAQALPLARSVGDFGNIAWLLYETGRLAFIQHDLAGASKCFLEGARLQFNLGYAEGVALSLMGLATIAIQQQEPALAARLLGTAKTQREPSSWLADSERAEYDHNVAVVRAELDEATFMTAWVEGQSMSFEQAIAGVDRSGQDERG